MRRLLAISPVLFLLGHALAELALALPDETWRGWAHAHAPGTVGTLTFSFVALRLIADAGLCAWAIGRHRIRAALPIGGLRAETTPSRATPAHQITAS